MDSQCAATSSCSTSPSQECYEIEGSGLTLISLLFNGLVSRLDLFKHGTHLFYRGPTIVAVGHITRGVAADVGPGAMVHAPILHHSVHPPAECMHFYLKCQNSLFSFWLPLRQHDLFGDGMGLR